MAKLNGPLGSKLRGKVGEVVAAKTVGGVTAIRAYQPVVKNPNTLRQQAARNKFAALSEVAAMFSYAIQIGYGKAVSGMKMYARNLFLQTAYNTDMLYTDGEIDYSAIPVSRKAGLDLLPAGATCVRTQGTGLVCKVGASVPITNDEGKRIGVVFVICDPNSGEVHVLPGTVSNAQSTGLILAEGAYTAGPTYNVYAFLKVMEETGTSISTESYPWKYPSATGASESVGTVATA